MSNTFPLQLIFKTSIPLKIKNGKMNLKNCSNSPLKACRSPLRFVCSESVLLWRPLQTGPQLLLVCLAHHAVELLACLLQSLQLGLLLSVLLLQELLVFGMLRHTGFLPFVVVDCAQSVEQGRHLQEQVKKTLVLVLAVLLVLDASRHVFLQSIPEEYSAKQLLNIPLVRIYCPWC